MFSGGGLAILDAIEASGYNTLEHRPSLSKWTQAKLLGKTLALSAFSRGGNSQHAAAAMPRKYSRRQSRRQARTNAVARDRSVIKLRPYSDAVRESYAECNRIARAARSSFYLAFFGLRKEKRNALCALYAFMRLIDDVSDEPGDLESKRQALARWRGMLDQAIGGHTERPRGFTGAGRHDRALPDSHAIFSRPDSRRGDGSDGLDLCDVRSPQLNIAIAWRERWG